MRCVRPPFCPPPCIPRYAPRAARPTPHDCAAADADAKMLAGWQKSLLVAIVALVVGLLIWYLNRDPSQPSGQGGVVQTATTGDTLLRDLSYL